MNMDLRLCGLAEKNKNLVLLDTSFPGAKFPEFKKDHGNRYICLPGRDSFVLDYAAGIASHGKIVLIYSEVLKEVNLADRTLNVKLIAKPNPASSSASAVEQQILTFGPSLLLIPDGI